MKDARGKEYTFLCGSHSVWCCFRWRMSTWQMLWRVYLAGDSSSLAAFSLFFFSVEVLACLYRQRDQLGNSREGLVCLFRSPRCHAESILIVARVFAVSISYDTLISKQPGPGWFFSLHACTWAGGLYGVCWDSNSNSIHMQQIRMAIRFNPTSQPASLCITWANFHKDLRFSAWLSCRRLTYLCIDHVITIIDQHVCWHLLVFACLEW
jgi:hypothetical protein